MGKMELAGTPLLPSSFARFLAGPIKKNLVMHELKQPKSVCPSGPVSSSLGMLKESALPTHVFMLLNPGSNGSIKHAALNEMTPANSFCHTWRGRKPAHTCQWNFSREPPTTVCV